MSFKNALTYQRVMRPDFPATMLCYLQEWGLNVGLNATSPFWERLAGRSRFCQAIYSATEQANHAGKDYDRQRAGHRYTVVNYSFTNHGTVEVRVLPMFPDVDTGIAAVQQVMKITNAFLVSTAEKEHPRSQEVIEEPEPLYAEARHYNI